MTRAILILLIATMVTAGGFVLSPTQAIATPADQQVPLMVLRYNQPRLYYDKQLFNAVKKALKVKPSVVFSVYSFVPAAGTDEQRKKFSRSANAQTAKFVSDLQRIGIPRDRITVSVENDPEARFHEIYLYVD